MEVAPHDVYFTIGETVGRVGASFPGLRGGSGITHHHPCGSARAATDPGGCPGTIHDRDPLGEATWYLKDRLTTTGSDTAFCPF